MFNEKVREFIASCQKAYYEGTPIITNEEYDALVKRFPDAETGIGPKGDIPHVYRMYSLQKVYFDRGDTAPFDSVDVVETRKFDGASIDLLFVNGTFVQALTRGNGIKGQDVTNNVKLLGFPKRIPSEGIVQITGEIVCTNDVENQRNYASGALSLDADEDFISRIAEGGLIFVAYGIQESVNHVGSLEDYESDMRMLDNWGFLTCTSTSSILEHCPTDGTVVRINSNAKFSEMGWTNKHPRGAYAIKEDDEGEITTLREVTWEVGRSGKVTPTAIFDEVVIADAKISRATLNNVGYIEMLGLELGCQIRVIRAGGIIPKIIERVD